MERSNFFPPITSPSASLMSSVWGAVSWLQPSPRPPALLLLLWHLPKALCGRFPPGKPNSILDSALDQPGVVFVKVHVSTRPWPKRSLMLVQVPAGLRSLLSLPAEADWMTAGVRKKRMEFIHLHQPLSTWLCCVCP